MLAVAMEKTTMATKCNPPAYTWYQEWLVQKHRQSIYSMYSHSVSASKLTLCAIKQEKGSEILKTAKEMKGVISVQGLKKKPVSDK